MIHPPLKKWAAIGGASVAFYSLVTSTALALFLPRATLQQMTFKAATLELRVSAHQVDQPDPNSFNLTADFPGTDTLIPGGQVVNEDFWVRNASSVGQSLILSGQLSAGNQDWEKLKPLIEANLRLYGTTTETGWKTLEEWTAQPHDFPGGELPDDNRRRYELQYRLMTHYPADPDAAGPLVAGSPIGHELMGLQTSGLSFSIDGRRQ